MSEAWSFISRKKLTASPAFAMEQKFREKVEIPLLGRRQLTERAIAAARRMRFKARVSEAEDRTTIFAERGVRNRLGAFALLIGLLAIFAGYFMTGRGHAGHMRIRPGQSSDWIVKNEFDDAMAGHDAGVRGETLPFTVECLDFQQKLMNKDGPLEVGNTVDWITTVRITDPETNQKTDAVIQMNAPFDYRGYRFFQIGYKMPATARTIKLLVTSLSGGESQEITIQRDGEAKLADGTRLRFIEFHSNDYRNPVADLLYLMPDGEQGTVSAFNEAYTNSLPNSPFVKRFMDNGAYRFVLAGFEKVPTWTVLQVKYDPGVKLVYTGFAILCLMLIGIYFFSHQRLWIVVEDGNVYLGGDAKGDRFGFEDRARKVAELIRQPQTAG